VLLRAPLAGRPSQSGIAIYLAHDYHELVNSYTTGGVAGAQAPLRTIAPDYDVWHKAENLLDGGRLRAAVDGVVVQDLDLGAHPGLMYRLKRGYIGFQALGYQYRLRNIQLEDLGARHTFVELFAGTLSGWSLRGGGSWIVRDGAMLGSNGHGILYAPPAFQDFGLTALVRSRDRVNSGIFLRGAPAGKQRGFEVQIYSPIDAVYPTGSIYGIERAALMTDAWEGRWFHMQILVEGRRCIVRLDGATVAETDRLPESYDAPGRIGLQIHKEGAAVEFKALRVRPRSIARVPPPPRASAAACCRRKSCKCLPVYTLS
jgi:hypothetical protein